MIPIGVQKFKVFQNTPRYNKLARISWRHACCQVAELVAEKSFTWRTEIVTRPTAGTYEGEFLDSGREWRCIIAFARASATPALARDDFMASVTVDPGIGSAVDNDNANGTPTILIGCVGSPISGQIKYRIGIQNSPEERRALYKPQTY